MPYYLAGRIEQLKAIKQAVLATKKLKMTKLLMISLRFLRFMKLKLTVFTRPIESLFAGFTNGALKMTRRLRMSISQKLASWKGSAEDAKAGQKPLRSLWPLWPKIFAICGKNQRNPRLINDLRLRKFTYEIINLFLQNEPKFRKVKLNLNKVLTMDYEQLDTWSIRNTKPIQSQSKPKQTQFKPNLSCRSLWRSRNKPNFKGKKMYLGGQKY